jgi:NAD+ diphosphatase
MRHAIREFVEPYPFEQMNQVIIAYHVAATGTITLNEELDDFRHRAVAGM